MGSKQNRKTGHIHRGRGAGEKTVSAKQAGAVRRGGEFYRRLDLPESSARGFPCLRLSGDAHLEVENYSGVLELTAKRIRLYTPLGILRILGSGLEIRCADMEGLLIDGQIASVAFENNE